MGKSLPLAEMSIEEKLRTMEEIWNDLVQNSENYLSPDWHRDVLAERARRVKSGDETPIDWKDAKKMIQKERK